MSSFNQYKAVENEYHFACTREGVYRGKMISALLDLWLSPIMMFLTFILLTFHCNRGPISYRCRRKRLLQLKIAKFPVIVYLAPLLKGSPWNRVPALVVKKLMGLPGRERSLTIFQSSGYNPPTWQRDRQTADRQTPGDSKDRAYIWRRGVIKFYELIIQSISRKSGKFYCITHWTDKTAPRLIAANWRFDVIKNKRQN